MKERVLAAMLAVIVVVFVVGTFYAAAKSILALIGLFTVISWLFKLLNRAHERKNKPDLKLVA